MFGDEYEPGDVGLCKNGRSGKDGVGAEDSCEYFEEFIESRCEI